MVIELDGRNRIGKQRQEPNCKGGPKSEMKLRTAICVRRSRKALEVFPTIKARPR